MIKLVCENCNADLKHEVGKYFKCTGCGVVYYILEIEEEPKKNKYIADKYECTYVVSDWSVATYG